MTRLYFGKRILTFFIGIVALFLLSTSESGAQNDALTILSGRVIDETGQPIAGLTVVIVPVQDGHGAWFPIEFEVEERGQQGDPIAFQAETDSEGRFVITDAIAGPVLLGLFPYNSPEAEILKVQIGDMFLYAPEASWGRGVVFSAEPGDRIEDVEVSEPIPPKRPPQNIETDELEPLSPAWEVPSVPAASHDVWVVNPENGHAYKRIHCETRDDAIAQATEEKAHLVAINDAAEQAWLEAVFGHKFYWIGLNRVPTTGALSKRAKKWWQWDNGDPITYANWLPNEFFSEASDTNERDYVVMTLSNGKWYAVSPDSVIWRMTEMAILEKADALDNPSAAEK